MTTPQFRTFDNFKIYQFTRKRDLAVKVNGSFYGVHNIRFMIFHGKFANLLISG